MAAPSEEKIICDKFYLEALTVNQVKSFKPLADASSLTKSYDSGPESYPLASEDVMVFNATFINMSVITWRSVFLA
jgi:hypothetical protein